MYKRQVIWVKNEFMEKQHRKNCDLSSCFQESLDRSFNLIRVRSSLQSEIQTIIANLEDSLRSTELDVYKRQRYHGRFDRPRGHHTVWPL